MTEMPKHRTGRVLTAAATAATAAALTAAATVPAASKTPPPGPPQVSPTATAGSNGIENESARTIAGKARHALQGAGSLHALFTDRRAASSAHVPHKADVTLDHRGNCTGSMVVGRGTVKMIKRGNDVWVRPDQAFWIQQVPRAGRTVSHLVGRRYVHGSTSNRFLKSIAAVCDLDTFRQPVNKAASGAAVLKKGHTTTVNGMRAVPLSATKSGLVSTLFVAAQGTPYPVETRVRGHRTDATTLLDRFGEPVPTSTPSRSDSIDVSRIASHLR